MNDLLFSRFVSVELEGVDGFRKMFVHDKDRLFRIDFEVNFDGAMTVKLFNVSSNTASMCEPKKDKNGKISTFPKLKLVVGYGSDRSMIGVGDVVQFNYLQSGADRVLDVKASPKVNFMNEIAIPKNYSGSYKSILKSILSDNGIDYYEILGDSSFSDNLEQFTVTGTLGDSIDKICKVLKSNKYFEMGKLIIASKDAKSNLDAEFVSLSRLTGLIGSPEKKNLSYSVKSLLNYRIWKNRAIEILFRDLITGKSEPKKFKVLSGKHSGSSWTSNFYTEFECKPV